MPCLPSVCWAEREDRLVLVDFPTGQRDVSLVDLGGFPVVWIDGVGIGQDPNLGGTNVYGPGGILKDLGGALYQIGGDFHIRPYASANPVPSVPATPAPGVPSTPMPNPQGPVQVPPGTRSQSPTTVGGISISGDPWQWLRQNHTVLGSLQVPGYVLATGAVLGVALVSGGRRRR